jgi:hypothetical protein
VADREAAARVLAGLEPSDRATFLLSHGLGLPLGEVAFALQRDPCVVGWRLRRALEPEGAGAAAAERGVASLLREELRGQGEAALRAALPPGTIEQLAARRTRDVEATAAAGGLGVGSLVLIVLAASVFLVYGILQDTNPLWRGMALARQGQYAEARQAFLEAGPLAEARAWVGLCWLAEGEFERGIEALRGPEASQFLAAFRPMNAPLVPVEADSESPALLPRGLVGVNRPEFTYRAGPAGVLTLELTVDALGRARPIAQHFEVPDTTGATPFATLRYPADAKALVPGTAVWWPPGGEERPASFTVIPRELQAEVRAGLERLTYEIPKPARDVLRSQFFLRHGLLLQAGEQLARLARDFPDAPWPRREVERVAQALAVDPRVLLR